MLRSRFEPASIDGEPITVYLSLRFLFQDTNGRCGVTVFPNLAVTQEQSALRYFAPQEIYTDGGWIQAIRGIPLYQRNRRGAYSGMAFVMSVAVDELGNPSDGRIEENNFAREESVQFAVDALAKQRFIPAMVNGVARPARYFEFIYVPEPPRRRLR